MSIMESLTLMEAMTKVQHRFKNVVSAALPIEENHSSLSPAPTFIKVNGKDPSFSGSGIRPLIIAVFSYIPEAEGEVLPFPIKSYSLTLFPSKSIGVLPLASMGTA